MPRIFMSTTLEIKTLIVDAANTLEFPDCYTTFDAYFDEFVPSHFPWNPKEMMATIGELKADQEYIEAVAKIKKHFGYDIPAVLDEVASGQ